jgi:hypothetical protein
VRTPNGAVNDASGYALSSKCDLLAAAAVGRDSWDRERVATLLESASVRGWITAKLVLGK